MSNASSLPAQGNRSGFDFATTKGVTSFLAALRASDLRPEQKNELRDLVFLYMNGGQDESVRLSLEKKVAAYQLQPPAPTAAELSAAQSRRSPLGMSRPAPVFSAPDAQPAAPKTPSSSAGQPATPAAEPKPAPVTAKPDSTPTPKVEQSTPAPAATLAPTPPQPTPPAANTETPATAAAPSAESSLQRIREIKSAINQQVGNPVNLIDINNDVGREYMGALLEAMKKVNTGSGAPAEMRRLEAAYQQVMTVLGDRATDRPVESPAADGAAEVAAKPASSPQETDAATKPATQPDPAPAPTEPVSQPAPVTPQPETPPAPAKSQTEPTPQPTEPTQPDPAPAPIEPAPQPEPATPQSEATPAPAKSQAETPPAPANAPTQEPAPKSGYENFTPQTETPAAPKKPEQASAPTAAAATVPVPPANATPTKESPSATSNRPSLADSGARLHTLSDLPSAASLESSSVSGDPLYTKAIDDGLQQLLSEWSLFKKSGLFGTGPKGREHPLFKKVAKLQIPLLLAGRFEGATQEIKQSITDYMNGWRYEQGIVYQPGETFEHYLRRVIKHILDLQKK